jgi:hypothetical protein
MLGYELQKAGNEMKQMLKPVTNDLMLSIKYALLHSCNTS